MSTIQFDDAKAHVEAVRQAYEMYTAKGWKCLPVDARAKVIRKTNWQNTTYSIDDFKGMSNIGVQMGAVSGNLIDIDLDHPLARKIAHWFLPKTGWRFGRQYEGEGDAVIPSHYLYHVEGDTKALADWRLSKKETGGQIVKCIEYRGDNTQTVFPPSVHEHKVQWIECSGEPPLIDEKELKQALGVMMTVIWVKHCIAPGIRHDSMLRVIGGFAKAGVPIEMAHRAVKAISFLIDDDEDKSGDVDDTYKKLAEGKTIAGFASLEAFGWETDRVKKWLPSKLSESGKVAKDGKPKLNLSKVSMEDAVNEAIKILDAVPNEEKRLFSYNNRSVAVVKREGNRYNDVQIVTPSADAFAHHLESRIQFVKTDGKEHVDILVEADSRLVRRMMDPSINWGLPQLSGVVMYPVLTPKGKLVVDEGFCADTGLFIGDNMKVTLDQVRGLSLQQAKDTIADVYDDFPFHNFEIGRSLSATALVSAIARKVITLSPMFIVTSPYPQDGKTEWSFIPQLVLSKSTISYALSHTEEEQQKQLVTYFMSDPSVLMFDNQNGKFKSQILTELLTSGAFSGRLLGTNDQAVFKPRSLIMANGINVAPSAEIATRSMIVEFDRRRDMNFKYPRLREHVLSKRRELICAGLRILLEGVDTKDTISFEPSRFIEWDQFVRKAIIASGYIDPMRSDLRVRIMDDDSEAREGLLEWLFRQFPPGVRFKSSDVMTRIGINVDLENLFKAIAKRSTWSSIVVGTAITNLRGAEYNGHRLSWSTKSGNTMSGEWKKL
jgi:hypothetical protein